MNFKALLYSFVFLSGFIFGNFQFQEKDILSSDEAFIFKADTRDNKTFLSWQIKPGYYLYKNSVSIEPRKFSSEGNSNSFNRLFKFIENACTEEIVSDFLRIMLPESSLKVISK